MKSVGIGQEKHYISSLESCRTRRSLFSMEEERVARERESSLRSFGVWDRVSLSNSVDYLLESANRNRPSASVRPSGHRAVVDSLLRKYNFRLKVIREREGGNCQSSTDC